MDEKITDALFEERRDTDDAAKLPPNLERRIALLARRMAIRPLPEGSELLEAMQEV